MPFESKFLLRLRLLLLRICILFLYGFVIVEIVDLAYAFSRAVTSTGDRGTRLLLSRDEVTGFSSVFLTILIALELAEALKVYLENETIRIMRILLIALIAIVRHLLALDYLYGEPMINFSLAALVIAVAGAYALIGHNERLHPS